MGWTVSTHFIPNILNCSQKRIQEVFHKARASLEAKEEIMRAIYEQTYDVRADLNNALIMFCQVRPRV